MAFMEKLREGTLADAIEKFALQSRQQSAAEADEGWNHMAMAPGHTLRDFLHDSHLTPPPALPSPPPPLRDTGLMYGPQNRPQEQTLGDREDPSSVPGVCGLLNLGNTCYMNAGLQCIRSIPEIASHYLSSTAANIEQSTTTHKGHLSHRLSTLLHKLWSGIFSSVHPKAFKTTLGLLHPQFRDNRQQDCQEFLAMLLDTLHEDFALMRQSSNQITESGSCDSDPTNQISDETHQTNDVTQNVSVVTQTFRGMLKNEVMCQKCSHLSVKEEPFFYLSVPLPHAFERQIYVQWMPVCRKPGTRQSVRLLVTVLKVVTLAVFKDALIDLIGRSLSHDLIQIAEVKDNCIVRLPTDTMAVKLIDDKTNELFAFELSPLPVISPLRTGCESEREGGCEGESGGVPGRKHSKGSDSEAEGLPAKMFKSEEKTSFGGGKTQSGAPVIIPPNEPTATPDAGDITIKKEAPAISQAVVMEWHSCAICLEEMVDCDLVTHKTCGAILCRACLQSSVDHYQKEGGLLPCPICSAVVKPSEVFTPLAEHSSSSNLVKLLQMTVLFRTLSSSGTSQCIAPPAVLRLPETAPGQEYYDIISPLLPSSLSSSEQWTINVTDAKGRYCSRCVYGSGCHGCTISRSSTHSLHPGDYITVTTEGMGEGECVMCEAVDCHPSLASKRESNLTLEECLKVFSQRDELVGDNHWFCPSCNDFQAASRVLSVSSLPQTVIIHLKRFIYHGTAGSKVDAPVSFPLELDPRLISHDCHMTQSMELAACVCHFGSMNCGHYTAYVKHMTSGEWGYCNDETVTMTAPSEKDSKSVYILFYRSKDLPSPTLPTILTSFDDEAEMGSVTQLLRQFKPHPSEAPPPVPRRSSSVGDLRAVTTDTITTEANQLLASLGLNPDSATIAHTLPTATSITQAQSIPRSPPPPNTPSSLLTPPPSNSSSITQTTPILEDYMNYDLSDDITTGSNWNDNH